MNEPEKQYGLQFPEGNILTYPNKKDALAAQERMRRWPTTKWVALVSRDVTIGPWEKQ